MSAENKTFTTTLSDVGMRVDKFLSTWILDFSRNEIQKFNVTKNGAPVKMSDRIKSGDVFDVQIPAVNKAPAACNALRESEIELDIIYEDADIIVVNKPRGVSMYAGAGHETDTLLNAVCAHTALSSMGGETRPGVVHRLDKDTSGAVIFAKTDAAYRALVNTFMEHNLTRKYIAFVWGVPNWESADISGNIARSAKNRQKMTMVKIGGKPAETHVDVTRVWARENISEFKCTLFTGRTHQIRVHLSSHGFPVLCDPTYGRGKTRENSVKNPELLEFVRTHHGQMLHAEILELQHPTRDEKMKFRAPLPDDMAELREILG